MQESDKNMKPAAIYLRRSTDRQEQSIADQQSELERYALKYGFEIIGRYVDDAVSGTSTKGRRDFLRMIKDAQKPGCPFRFILVYDIKRFSRGDNDEAGYYRYLLRQHGVEIIYVAESFSGDDTDDMVRPVKQWHARQESKDLSKVTLRGQLSSIKGGWWNGGQPPYGYDLQYFDSAGIPFRVVRFLRTGEKEILDTEGKLVRTLAKGNRVPKTEKDKAKLVLSELSRVSLVKRIFDLYIRERMGFKTIAATLNREGILSPRNGHYSRTSYPGWSQSTIKSIIDNPTYTGDMVWNRRSSGKFYQIVDGRAEERKGLITNTLVWNREEDWERVSGAHPAIIDRKTFEEAQRLKKSRRGNSHEAAYNRGRGKNSVYLLSGLIHCNNCGHTFIGHTCTKGKTREDGSKVKTYYYLCAGYLSKGTAICRKVSLPSMELEADILGRIRSRFDAFLKDGGEELLRKLIVTELKNNEPDPQEHIPVIKKKISGIDEKAGRLVDRLADDLMPEAKCLIEEKLNAITKEKQSLEKELGKFELLPRKTDDIQKLVDEAITSLKAFEEVFREGTLEEKKEFIRLFIDRIELDAGGRRAAVHIRRFPGPYRLDTGKSSFSMVAGAGFEPATFGL